MADEKRLCLYGPGFDVRPVLVITDRDLTDYDQFKLDPASIGEEDLLEWGSFEPHWDFLDWTHVLDVMEELDFDQLSIGFGEDAGSYQTIFSHGDISGPDGPGSGTYTIDQVERIRNLIMGMSETPVVQITVTMGFGKGDTQMDDTVEVKCEGIDPLPEGFMGQDYGRDRGVIATFASPDVIDWGWIGDLARTHGATVDVTFVGQVAGQYFKPGNSRCEGCGESVCSDAPTADRFGWALCFSCEKMENEPDSWQPMTGEDT